MGMKKGQKQYGDAFHARVRELRLEGKTRREIAEEMDVEYEVIRWMFTRQNSIDRQFEKGTKNLSRTRGRPRIRPMTTEDEYRKQIKELKMENEVLKKYREELRRCKK